jgi:type I restriction enzyme R subunit
MPTVGQLEIETQERVIRLFTETLGYRFHGNWKDREENANVEEEHLSEWLRLQGHNDRIIRKVLIELSKAKALSGSKTLYDANREFYRLLRYGVKVKPDVGMNYVTVWLIDWKNTDNNDFSVAEEVTVEGRNTKRPDIVIYVNGIALCVLELKRSIISVTEGVRQSLDSQKKEFIRPFFSTVQFIMAGNDTEGLRYGVIETPEKYWLRWKELGYQSTTEENSLLRELSQFCCKKRLLELIHDFLVFDAGIKKTCRHNQYFGVKAAQEHVLNREGGIIWHTQGSGKSLTMVWLAKWIREHVEDARVLLVTDRTELDEQIEKVFKGVEEDIYRTQSGADLVSVLNAPEKWLICSLVHKFGGGDDLSDRDVETFVEEIKKSLPAGFSPKGGIFVFVDECHRCQSGKLHKAMTVLLPEAMFIGFTGTPLLKEDKQTSTQVFGPYIHTYKYDEAVRDGVVLDLRYEARDIDQSITSQSKVDQWFEVKTKGLTDYARAQLKQRWGTMQKVLSAQNRLEKIAADIMLDMETRDRLSSGHGNALLVSDSIYSACRFFELFNKTDLKAKCAIVTSYKPQPSDIKGEETGEGLTERLLQYEVYRRMLAEHFDEPEDKAMYKVEQFEKEVKKRFIEEPGQMKLLIVVDKLMTGFDAPPATYLYIDKQMRDHGLFQAICRVNRLHTEDKEYGYVVDYKDLFRSLEKAIKDYTCEAFDAFDEADVKGLLKDRLEKARERLDETREAIKALCETVESKETIAYLCYFCAAVSGDAEQLKNNGPKRVKLYKLSSLFLRAYANIANEMLEAGYSEADVRAIRDEVAHYEKVREEVKLASGDYVDLKLYEPAMRHLLDTYIRAEESEKLSAFDDLTLVDLIVERGEAAVEKLPEDIRKNQGAVAETIENNVRRLIIDETAVNPKYYERMSELLDALIEERRRQALDYKDYLAKIVDLTRRVKQPDTESYPQQIKNPALRALYDNLKPVAGLEGKVALERLEDPQGGNDFLTSVVLAVDDAIIRVRKADWRDNNFKRREVSNAIQSVLKDDALAETIFEIVKEPKNGY